MEEDRVYPPPQFIVPLRDVNQIEGGKVHFEARIEPVGDPTMKVEWFLNGRLIVASKFFSSGLVENLELNFIQISRLTCQQYVPVWIYCLGLDQHHRRRQR